MTSLAVLALMSFVLVCNARLENESHQGGRLPDPGNFALILSEEEFEDYLDDWLVDQRNTASPQQRNNIDHTGCSVSVNGDLGHPQPVYLRNNSYAVPTGTTGVIHFTSGEQIHLACTGSSRTIVHPNITTTVASALATCENGTLFSGAEWLNGPTEFSQLGCSSHSYHEAQATNERCYNDNLVIRVGFTVNETFHPLYWSCFDQNRLEVLYVWYKLTPPNAVHQTNVDRPSWLAGSFFPGVTINTQYTQVQQKLSLASLVGEELADKYITSTQFLARGHLAAKTDFIYATGQRASFYFINAAPQWQPNNAGNWNWVEQNLRTRIGEAGYNTIIYTGTFGVTQLRDQSDQLVDFYLHQDVNNNPQIPVPLYYYKVVYEESRRLGTAFVMINNPYYTEAEVRQLQFCEDQCRNNSAFDWLRWQPDRIDIGYSFCCTVNDFRKVVPHLPEFEVDDLLA